MMAKKGLSIEEEAGKSPHLGRYLTGIKREDWPSYIEMSLGLKVKDNEGINYLYKVSSDYFVHVTSTDDGFRYYSSICPELAAGKKELYEKIHGMLLGSAFYSTKNPISDEDFSRGLEGLYEELTHVSKIQIAREIEKKVLGKIELLGEDTGTMIFFLKRNLAGLGLIQPFVEDPFLEEISCVGSHRIWIYHKVFGAMESNLHFDGEIELEKYTYKITEILDRPATDAHPVVDLALPDGSRLNALFGKDISRRGTSFTIRKFTKTPVSITQLISWGTVSPKQAAYLWMCIENNLSVFMCGETASGKTTTLKALTVFIEPTAKIYSVEDTPEIYMPHKNWQRTISTEGKVSMFDLLGISLVSRPNYIIVGEFRDQQGAVAFQAMQAGYPVMATFHAGNIDSLVQRLTGDPIFIPKDFLANLNLVIFQQAVSLGERRVRRAVMIHEIEGYSSINDAIVTRNSFVWNAARDNHDFTGLYNSYALEGLVGEKMKIKSKKNIYLELDKREEFIKKLVENKVFDYYDVFDAVRKYRLEEGVIQ